MNILNPQTQGLIADLCKGKSHIKLTVGAYCDGEKTIKVFNEAQEIPNEGYIYEIGSITKTFTASLLAKYVFEQKMSLEDSIQKYISGLDDNVYYPTLRRLATHTAGYPCNLVPMSVTKRMKLIMDNLFARQGQGEFPFQMDFEKKRELTKKYKLSNKDYPYQYSNFGIALLGYAVGVVSGKGYWDEMSNFISEELGLTNTYLGIREGNLHGYNRKNQDIGNWNWNKDLFSPAGCISSTAEDLLEFARLNMYDEMPFLSLCHQKFAECKQFDMGLAWRISKQKKHVLQHTGETDMFRSFLVVDKENKRATTVLVNYGVDISKLAQIGVSIQKSMS